MFAVPVGTLRSAYLPSALVVVNKLVPTTMTRASWSGTPPGAVTVPVNVPCAAAIAAVIVNSATDSALRTMFRGLISLIVQPL
jgi:hypothetical protein